MNKIIDKSMKKNWKLIILIIFILLFVVVALFIFLPNRCEHDFKAYPEKGYCEFNYKTCESLFGCKEYNNVQVPCGSVSTLCGKKVLCDCGDLFDNENTTQNKNNEQNIIDNDSEAIEGEISNWEVYLDPLYGYEFKYPGEWNLLENNNSPDDYNVTIWNEDGFNKDNIQIVKAVYGVNADGSINDRTSYLDRLEYDKFIKVSVGNGKAYYYLSETKGGPIPMVYLVGDKEIFIMSYNIYEKSASLSEAETLFKKVVKSFKFN